MVAAPGGGTMEAAQKVRSGGGSREAVQKVCPARGAGTMGPFTHLQSVCIIPLSHTPHLKLASFSIHTTPIHTNSPHPPPPQLHLGQHWDFVFDVDAEEGAPPKKLACNRGENPYIVADRFLQQEELPVGYREQVCGGKCGGYGWQACGGQTLPGGAGMGQVCMYGAGAGRE